MSLRYLARQVRSSEVDGGGSSLSGYGPTSDMILRPTIKCDEVSGLIYILGGDYCEGERVQDHLHFKQDGQELICRKLGLSDQLSQASLRTPDELLKHSAQPWGLGDMEDPLHSSKGSRGCLERLAIVVDNLVGDSSSCSKRLKLLRKAGLV